MRQVRINITGKVQGVCYRASACAKAHSLGLKGRVRNCLDGSVEAIVQGENDRLNDFILWCKAGPPSARVANVSIIREPITESFNGFEIDSAASVSPHR